jgi:hypothetical protein
MFFVRVNRFWCIWMRELVPCESMGWSGFLVLGCLTRGESDLEAKRKKARVFRGMCVF